MKEFTKPSIIFAFTLGAILFGSHFVFSFTEPGQLPAGGNVLPPLDTSATGQAKAGGLIINTGGASVGFIVDKGSVGIGTSNPGGTLDVQGSSASPIGVFNQNGTGNTATFQADGSTLFSIGRDGLCWLDVCKTSWADAITPVTSNIFIKTSDSGSFSSSQSNNFTSEGDVTLSNDSGLTYKSFYGYHYYDNLTIPEGVTVKVPTGKGGLALIVRNNLTIRGTINADGAAFGGHGAGGGGAVDICYGTDENGKCTAASTGYAGGSAIFDGTTIIAGGSPGYGKPAQTPAHYVWGSRHILLGGSSGGNFYNYHGTWGSVGVGGGDVYIKAGTVHFTSSARVTAKGTSGSGGGGGGAGGNIIIEAQSVIDEGVVFTQAGGSGANAGSDGQVLLVTPLYTNQYVDTSGLDLANKTQTFNPGLNSIGGPHSFTVPTGVTSVTVELWGAGGGGGGGNEVSCGGCFYAGGGGGGGAYAMVALSVTPGAQIPVTAGAGGTGSGGFGSSRGATGGSSIFDSTAVAGGTGGCTGWEPGSSCGGSPGDGATTNLSNGVNGANGSGATGGQGGNGGAGGGTNANGSAPGGGAGGGWGAHSTGPSGGGGKVIVRW